MSGRTRVTVRVHSRARSERLEWDGSTLQLWVREPPADGRANAAVIRAVARWAKVAPSQVVIVLVSNDSPLMAVPYGALAQFKVMPRESMTDPVSLTVTTSPAAEPGRESGRQKTMRGKE